MTPVCLKWCDMRQKDVKRSTASFAIHWQRGFKVTPESSCVCVSQANGSRKVAFTRVRKDVVALPALVLWQRGNVKDERTRVTYCVCLHFFFINQECLYRKKPALPSAQGWGCCAFIWSRPIEYFLFSFIPWLFLCRHCFCIDTHKHKKGLDVRSPMTYPFRHTIPGRFSRCSASSFLKRGWVLLGEVYVLCVCFAFFAFTRNTAPHQQFLSRSNHPSIPFTGQTVFFILLSVTLCPSLTEKDIDPEEYAGNTLIGIPQPISPIANTPPGRPNFYHDERHCRGQLCVQNTTERKFILIASISKDYWSSNTITLSLSHSQTTINDASHCSLFLFLFSSIYQPSSYNYSNHYHPTTSAPPDTYHFLFMSNPEEMLEKGKGKNLYGVWEKRRHWEHDRNK